MASYFLLELDTTPPAIEVGEFSWHGPTGTLEVEIVVDDPEAVVAASFQAETGEPVSLNRNGDTWWYSFGDEYIWAQGQVTVTAVDAVWNSSSVVQQIEKDRLPTVNVYRTLERYPTRLEEFVRFVTRLVARRSAKAGVRARERYPVRVDAEDDDTI